MQLIAIDTLTHQQQQALESEPEPRSPHMSSL